MCVSVVQAGGKERSCVSIISKNLGDGQPDGVQATKLEAKFQLAVAQCQSAEDKGRDDKGEKNLIAGSSVLESPSFLVCPGG